MIETHLCAVQKSTFLRRTKWGNLTLMANFMSLQQSCGNICWKSWSFGMPKVQYFYSLFFHCMPIRRIDHLAQSFDLTEGVTLSDIMANPLALKLPIMSLFVLKSIIWSATLIELFWTIPTTPTPWLTLLLVLGKSGVNQNLC